MELCKNNKNDVIPTERTVKEMVEEFSAKPGVYGKNTREYSELMSLDDLNEWSEFCDELAKCGMTVNYNNVYDTFTIG